MLDKQIILGLGLLNDNTSYLEYGKCNKPSQSSGVSCCEYGPFPSNYCYLDFCQDDPTREPVAAAAFLTLAQAYSYDPAPDSLGADVVPMILGVQGRETQKRFVRVTGTDFVLNPVL